MHGVQLGAWVCNGERFASLCWVCKRHMHDTSINLGPQHCTHVAQTHTCELHVAAQRAHHGFAGNGVRRRTRPPTPRHRCSRPSRGTMRSSRGMVVTWSCGSSRNRASERPSAFAITIRFYEIFFKRNFYLDLIIGVTPFYSQPNQHATTGFNKQFNYD